MKYQIIIWERVTADRLWSDPSWVGQSSARPLRSHDTAFYWKHEDVDSTVQKALANKDQATGRECEYLANYSKELSHLSPATFLAGPIIAKSRKDLEKRLKAWKGPEELSVEERDSEYTLECDSLCSANHDEH